MAKGKHPPSRSLLESIIDKMVNEEVPRIWLPNDNEAERKALLVNLMTALDEDEKLERLMHGELAGETDPNEIEVFKQALQAISAAIAEKKSMITHLANEAKKSGLVS